jgi:GNAT superfamily N-acetyltransferase
VTTVHGDDADTATPEALPVSGEPYVRRLVPGDRAQWEPLWQGYLTFYESSLSQRTTDSTFARLLDDDNMGALVGLAHYVVHPTTWDTRPVCYLEDLFVDPSQRGAGVGRALIESLRDIGRREGWAEIYWMTAADNVTARRLYDRVAQLGNWVRYEMAVTDDG